MNTMSLSDAKNILWRIEMRHINTYSHAGTNDVYYDPYSKQFYKVDGARQGNVAYANLLNRRLENEMLALHYAPFLGVHTSTSFGGVVISCQNENITHGHKPYHYCWQTVKLFQSSKVSGCTVLDLQQDSTMDSDVRDAWLTRAATDTIVTGTIFDDSDRNTGNTLIDIKTGAISQIDLEQASIKKEGHFSAERSILFLSNREKWWYDNYKIRIAQTDIITRFEEKLSLLERNKSEFAPDHYDLFRNRALQGISYCSQSGGWSPGSL